MIQYYLFMGLLIFTLILWGIIAFREDAPVEEDEGAADAPTAATDAPAAESGETPESE